LSTENIAIVGAARTPLGSLQGQFKTLSATELGAVAIRAALDRAGLDTNAPDEVFMGCVLPAGLGQAPARQASLGAGIPNSVGCTTVNKVCGSGMKAAMLGHDAILAGSARVVVAGGMESMSNAPYLLAKARGGYRLGHGTVYDHMFLDGLEDAYERGSLMGKFAEDTAQAYQFTRETQDAFATESLARAKRATADGTFAREIVPVRVDGADVTTDELPQRADPAKIPKLKPRLSRRRHRDGSQFQRHFRRRRRTRSDEPIRSRKPRGRAARSHRRVTPATHRRRNGSPPLPSRHTEAAGKIGLEAGRRGPLRDQ
jgi:acetyl-CoA C-acetyltransferase